MRIVIVEDEIKIREGMGKMIESQTEHVIVGEAMDGSEGLHMILQLKPDLVITDIRMPHMDGLEMLEELAKRKRKVHTVILSGYSEFAYAQKAIRFGVDAYLLKPLAADDVKTMLAEVEERIREEKTLKYGHPENRLRDSLFGNVEETEAFVEELCNVCGFEPDMKYDLAAAYIGAADASYKTFVEDEITVLRDMYGSFRIYLLYQENRQMFYCLTASRSAEAEERERYNRTFFCRMLGKNGKKEGGPVWTNIECNVRTLQEKRNQLEQNLSYALVLEHAGWITEKMIHDYQEEPYEYPLDIANQLKNAICRGERDAIIEAGDAFAAYMRTHEYLPSDIRYGFMKIYYLVEDTLRDLDITLHEHLKNSGILRRMESVLTFGELQSAWEDLLHMISGERVKREDISNYIIKKAINYIREHYQEGITQEEVSRKLEITPEYLSTLFNREMGINFTLFLKRFRISHAKRLLKGTDMKIYEVAEAVGYSDAKYFARVFKEEQGITPGEYRQMN